MWFLGTTAGVKFKKKEAEQKMRGIEDGENMSLSDISFSHCRSFQRFEQQVSESPILTAQNESDSDCEEESFAPPKQRIMLKISANEANDAAKEVTNAELVGCHLPIVVFFDFVVKNNSSFRRLF